MKHYNYLLLLPIALLFAIVVSSCSGLTDEEKKFVGTWSSEDYIDSTMEDSNMRYIAIGWDNGCYNEDRTCNVSSNALIKLEWEFRDVDIRLYWYIIGTSKSSWSAKDGVYSDSTITQSYRNVISPQKEVAIRDKRTGTIEHYGLYDKTLMNKYDADIVKGLRETYKEFSKFFFSKEGFYSNSKSVYKIVSLNHNQIVYEDNDGEKTTLNKGTVMSDRVKQMMAEGEALK